MGRKTASQKPSQPNLQPGVFLDRDGTIIRHVPYLSDPKKIRLLPGAAAAIKRLNKAGIPVVMVSNQSGVARGLMTEAEVQAVNREMEKRLAKQGARLEGIEYCPHYPQGKITRYAIECLCRKPAPGMLKRAAQALGIDLARSVIIGDNRSDIETGWKVGASTILLLSGHGRETRKVLRQAGRAADYTTSSLAKAVAWWLGK